MANIPGSVRFTGFIAPTDSTDTYPVFKPIYGLGGMRTVPDLIELSAITSERREPGMIVYVSGASQYYKLESGLTNSDWTLLNLTGSSIAGYFLPLSGGTVTGDTYFTQGLSAYTFSAGTINSGSTNLYDIFLTIANSGITGNFIPMTGTGANLVTGDVIFDDAVNIAWTTGSDFLQYNPVSTNVELATSNGFDVTTGTIFSAGTPLQNIFLTTSNAIWTSSTGTNSIVANNGTGNFGSGNFAIIGGYSNSGTGLYSAIINGKANLASGNGAFIGGGSGHTASGTRSFIGNGGNNIASGNGSFVGGGQQNMASGSRASVLGGRQNSATTILATIAGGRYNIASGPYSFIGNGRSNSASTYYSFIGTGNQNLASGYYSLVLAGYSNRATGSYSSVFGGGANIASGNYSFVIGGNNNNSTGANSFVIGGASNRASGLYAVTVNGFANSVTGARSAVIGGQYLTGTSNDTVYVPYLNVNSASTNNTITNVLVRDINGDVYLSTAFSGAIGNFIPMTGTGANVVTGDIAIDDAVNLSWNNGNETLHYNPVSTNVELTTSNGFDVVTGAIMSAGTDLYAIFGTGAQTLVQPGLNTYTGGSASAPTVNISAATLSYISATTLSAGTINSGSTNLYDIFLTISNSGGTGFSGWTASSGVNSIIANNGTGNIASSTYSIVGGRNNSATSPNSFIGAGYNNRISSTNAYGSSFIGAGWANSAKTSYTSIVGGFQNLGNASYSFIGGGLYNATSGLSSVVVGGRQNSAFGNYSFVGGGFNNRTYSLQSSIVGGTSNKAKGLHSFIGGGYQNTAYGFSSVAIGGLYNLITGGYSFIGGGGGSNFVSGNYSSVISGILNSATTANSMVVGGRRNLASGSYSSIINGSGNTVTGTRSTVLGGINIVGTANDTVYVPFLNIKSANTNNSLTSILVRDTNGDIYLKDGSALSGTGVQAVQPGSNITTGGTLANPIINLAASPSVNGLSVSGTGNFTGTLQSGGTDLYNIFVQGSGTNGTVPLWCGSTVIGNSLITQTGTGVTVNGSVYIYGNVDVLGTATTFNTQTIQTADNNITLNMSGSHLSAYGGGITVLSGTPNGGSSTWTIDANGSWSSNTTIITSALTVNNGNINVNGGGQLQSGGTDLYNIFATAGSGVQAVQPGTNIITAGTLNYPIVSTVDSPIFNNITFSGTGLGNALSATTLSAGTINSGSTNLYQIFATTGATVAYWSASTGVNSIIANNSTNNLASGKFALVAGESNSATTTGATVIGGLRNTASGLRSFVGSGSGNTSSNSFASVVGGQSNLASGTYSFIGGGQRNNISGTRSVIGGGQANIATGTRAFIGGGSSNSASTSYSVVVGGLNNASSGIRAFIGNGSTNSATTTQAVVVGGQLNASMGISSFIGAGQSNKTYGTASVVVGGLTNTAFNQSSFVGAGNSNQAGGQYGAVVAGSGNTVAADFGFIGAGHGNYNGSTLGSIVGGYFNNISVLGNFSFIGGGKNNTITGSYYNSILGGWLNNNGGRTSAIVTGKLNQIQGYAYYGVIGAGGYNKIIGGTAGFIAGGTYNILGQVATSSFIGAGNANSANTSYSSVIAGTSNLASGSSSVVIGGSINKTYGNASVVIAGTNNRAFGNSSIIGGGQGNTTSAYLSSIVGGFNNTASAQNSFIGGGNTNNASGLYATIVNGNANRATGTRSFIGNGQGLSAGTTYSTIVNGQNNIAAGITSFVGNGLGNKTFGAFSFIGNGNYSIANSAYSSVINGKSNTASTIFATVVNGVNNIASGIASAVLAGTGHTVSGINSAIVGGSGINASSNNTTYVPFFNIQSATTNNALTSILVRNTNGDIYLRDASTLSGGTSGATTTASNGLTKIGNNIVLGGDLTGSTYITDANSGYTFDVTMGDQATGIFGTVQVANYQSGSYWGDNSIGRIASTSVNASGAFINTTDTGGTLNSGLNIFSTPAIYANNGNNNSIVLDDNISGKGAIYAADYSSGFTYESLVTKRYVDKAITGSTSGITGNFLSLSGGTVTGGTQFTSGLSSTTTSNASFNANIFTSGNPTNNNGDIWFTYSGTSIFLNVNYLGNIKTVELT